MVWGIQNIRIRKLKIKIKIKNCTLLKDSWILKVIKLVFNLEMMKV